MSEDNTARACGTYRGGEKMHTGFWWGNPKERGNLKPSRTSWEGVY